MNINLNNTDNNDYVRGYKDGRKAGATEWGKAQNLIAALNQIRNWSGGMEDAAFKIKVIASDALNKYKEVGNG
jgi:hypothetical protein